MSKEYDIKLNRVIECDVILNKSLTECDIIVNSIPFRDGISAANKVILESCLNYYILQKMVAVQSGSNLVSHIDKMIKTCYERLSFGADLNSNVSFNVLYALQPDVNKMVISAENMGTISNMFAEANQKMIIAVEPLFIDSLKSIGVCNSGITLRSQISGELKRSFETVNTGTEIRTNILGTNAEKNMHINGNILVDSSLQSLCYQLLFAGHSALEMSAAVLGTSIRFSFGSGSSRFAIGSYVSGTEVQKFEAIQAVSDIVANVLHDTILCFIVAENHETVITSSAALSIRRYRLLSELDGSGIGDMDDISLDDLSYITLDG